MEIAVEVFEQGQMRSFVRRYESDAIHVGRGWDNDIIIRDPLVDASHLVIRSGDDGGMLVEDRESTNGTRLGRKRLRGTASVDFDQPIHLGHSQIRLHRVDQPVAPTLRLGKLDELVAVFHHPVMAMGLALAAVLMGLHYDLLGDPAETAWSVRASQALSIAAGLSVWAIVWGSIARVLRHEMAFWAHLSLASALIVLSLGVSLLMDWIGFNTLSIAVTEALAGLAIAGILFLAVLVGMAVTARVQLRSMLAVAGGVAFVALSLVYLLPALDDEQEEHNRPEMITIAQRPGLLVLGTRPVGDFLAEAETIFSQLDRQREEMLAESAAE